MVALTNATKIIAGTAAKKTAANALRVNKMNYDSIAEATAKKHEPTVYDEAYEMSRRGNQSYAENWGGYREEGVEEEFPLAHLSHEFSHICARIPHSAQGELWALAFQGGLNFGLALRQMDGPGVSDFNKGAEEAVQRCVEGGTKYEETPARPISKRDWAIYMAAGMYLHEKMDRFIIEGMQHKPYAKRLEWCNAYEKKDHVPAHEHPEVLNLEEHFTALDEENELMYRCYEAPNALIHLSPEEWRVIEGVALGILEPQQTSFPGRMTAIKEALVKVGMFFDKPRFAEKLETEKITKAQHASIGNTYTPSGKTAELWQHYKANKDPARMQKKEEPIMR